MKVESNKPSINKKTKSSKSDLEQKLKAKFGDKFKPKQEQDQDKVELSKKKKIQESEHKFALKSDIKDNSADSELTQEKLKGLLRSGAFNFNDGERRALSEILGV